MLFRFNGTMPTKVELTCQCSSWTVVDHIVPSEHPTGKPKRISCDVCGQEALLWQQMTHWHLQIIERGGLKENG